MIMKFKGVSEVTRYKFPSEVKEHPKYLTIYTFENADAYKAFQTCPELTDVMTEMGQTWEKGDINIKWMMPYEPIKTWKRRAA